MQFTLTLLATALLAATTTLAAPAVPSTEAIDTRASTTFSYSLLGGGGIPSDSSSGTLGAGYKAANPKGDSVSQLVAYFPGPASSFGCAVHAKGPVQPRLVRIASGAGDNVAKWNIGPPVVVDQLRCYAL